MESSDTGSSSAPAPEVEAARRLRAAFEQMQNTMLMVAQGHYMGRPGPLAGVAV